MCVFVCGGWCGRFSCSVCLHLCGCMHVSLSLSVSPSPLFLLEPGGGGGNGPVMFLEKLKSFELFVLGAEVPKAVNLVRQHVSGLSNWFEISHFYRLPVT